MKICVLGLGYVGLTTAAALADWGHIVSCVNHDRSKLERLSQGEVPIYEPCLSQLVNKNIKAGRLSFHRNVGKAIADAQIIFLAVQTPMSDTGEADISFLLQAASEVAAALPGPRIIVTKSTAPPGTARKLQEIFGKSPHPSPVVVNPEFLREGAALEDVMHPDRVVIGGEDVQAVETIAGLYEHLGTEILKTDRESAEMIKYASNAFLATKISFANALARLCDKVGANVDLVTLGVGLDKRIGPEFLRAGLGYGGSCFPKDVSGLVHWAKKMGYDFALLKEVQGINKEQVRYVLGGIKKMLGEDLHGKHLALLGLSFKPNTDDIRESPALGLAELLKEEGASLSGYDPQAMVHVAASAPYIKLCPDIVTACIDADAILLLTDWVEFAKLKLDPLAKVAKDKVLIDARNLYDPKAVREHGWRYWSVGRP